MAKTFKLNVSFPLTLVVSSETVADFVKTRVEAREILASGKPLTGEAKFRVELMASDKSDDEVLQTIYRAGIRSILREDFVKELCGNESHARLGDTLVVFEKRPEASLGALLAPCCCGNCLRCNGYE